MKQGDSADAMSVELEVPPGLHGQRVDRALSLLTGASRRVAAQAVEAGTVTLDGYPVRARSTLLRTGQRLQAVVQGTPRDLPVADSSVAFEVVYKDDDIVVVDKPAGLVVHHGAGQRAGTLVDGLLARFPDIGDLGDPSGVGDSSGVGEPGAGKDDAGRPGIVHRLDKGTSGLLVVARSRRARASLAEQFRVHSAERRYLALVAGTVESDRGQVDAPIGRSARRPDRMAVTPSGRPARTSYTVRQRYDSPLAATMVEATLDTGRTHQVRVHLAAVGHPVIGDDRYGGTRARPAVLLASLGRDRLFLHAWKLSFEHPDGRRVSYESALPPELEETLKLLS